MILFLPLSDTQHSGCELGDVITKCVCFNFYVEML